MKNKYIAEFVGTFALSFVVLAAVSQMLPLPVAIPVIAGLTLGLFVYTIGGVSGAHINPAVTIGLWSIKKITNRDAVAYIVAQIFAAAVAIVLARTLGMANPEAVPVAFIPTLFFAEALGAFFFAFGIAAVVYGKVAEQMSGVVVGGSLLLGILLASFSGSAGILNPAVAFALNAVSVMYIVGPIAGAVVGFHAYRYLTSQS
ncbi:aquaporin [Patescibacteria group bacterium]|nr:aquaporin [Patescibacteria group bacterium]